MPDRVALIVRHKTKPGQRQKMQAVWERFIQPNVRSNPGHLAYYFTEVEGDPDGVLAFQIFASSAAKEAFLKGDWYPQYLDAVSEHVATPPEIISASVIWSKNETN
ncbi:MAG: hypothetical protein SynsKO_14420 [Synoicihabitans sp.]